MARYKEPKDYMLGRRAYEAFYDEQPQIWFEDLGHNLQVRWARVARAVVAEGNRLKRPTSVNQSDELTEAVESLEEITKGIPKTPGGRLMLRTLPDDRLKKVKAAQKRVWDLKKATESI